jgi:diguanylate cyclase (GGDEF)-like protein/PAS domain S-box-containing protein
VTQFAATILIVDDDARNRKLLELLLGSQGYRTMTAVSGEDALKLIERQAPDLIILDVVLPGMTGYEVARALKADQANSNIPIIMATVKIDREARIEGLKAGAEEFLTKPIDRAELWLRVRNLLRLKALGDLLADHGANLERQILARTADLQRFRTAMDSTADAILLISRSTMRIIETNATTSAMLGYSREELLRMSPADLGEDSLKDYERKYDRMIDRGATEGDVDPAEITLRRHDGTMLMAEVRWHAMRSGEDWIIVAVLRDITERKEAEMRLHRLAHYDALTGLPNRTLFYDTLSKTLVRAADRQWTVAVLFIDLDRFKSVNDTLGHAAGDALLQQFADRLVECVRIRDTIGRLGGDEFGVILTIEGAPARIAKVVGKIRDAVRAPFALGRQAVPVTASIGITLYPADADDAESLIKFADTAMYGAKQAGRDTYRFFTAEMNESMLAKLDLEVALRQAVEKNEFMLHYQPKVDIVTERIVGFEALLRWDRPGFGLVPPAIFIPILEDAGLIVPVGSWVIDAACKQIGAWLRSDIGPMPISVNVSARQFTEGDLEGVIMDSLKANGVDPGLLELELTESTLMVNTERTIATLRSLKSRGVQISIDDFGTGYSSLAYLRRFTIDKVKIDMSFVQDIVRNADDAAIVLAIISMAHSLRLGVIAEGVETVEQLAYLRHHGCDEVQGHYFGKPAPAEDAESMLREDIQPRWRVNPTSQLLNQPACLPSPNA